MHSSKSVKGVGILAFVEKYREMYITCIMNK